MTNRLEGKTAIITGGTEGIGLATAKLFVKEGAYVFITGRRRKELDEAVKTIGSNATGVQGDVAKLADLDRLYETVGKVKGRVDIIFANAGVGEFVPFGKVSEEHFDKLININVKGAFFTVHAADTISLERWRLHHSHRFRHERCWHCRLWRLRQPARRRFALSCAPGLQTSKIVISGRMLLAQAQSKANFPLVNRQSADVIARIVATVPMGSICDPDEVAKAVLDLASDDSSFVTGIELFVDGGRAQV